MPRAVEASPAHHKPAPAPKSYLTPHRLTGEGQYPGDGRGDHRSFITPGGQDNAKEILAALAVILERSEEPPVHHTQTPHATTPSYR